MSIIRIDRRFRGPPDSGNGGYVAGRLAAALGGSGGVVTLRSPPPLDTDLRIDIAGDDAALLHESVPVAVATRMAVHVDVPPPPGLAEAEAAEAGFTGFDRHIFPGCFVCGPDRACGDGLRLFAGRIRDGGERVAAAWTPAADLGDGAGRVAIPFLWAALDCPGYFAVEALAGRAVLGRIGAVVRDAPETGEPLIVTGWAIAHDGRKHRAGTAIHRADGRLAAAAVATWISIS
ncbi:hypothetical protein IC614_07580 [Allosphingosinicella flava]|uniref:Thioesterase family protein n=1 Tax=Allosphingosinicella flava TaxID=2771430 RepID=A0A7T2GHZ2_9SPHN|nr:hypothetical protein [Sphingosinicella flava]QPQ54225.1 hypothetical protein IC614_07580 [Sphingosinicella flava]